jgi:nitrogen-specific signal transduction histidine kinase
MAANNKKRRRINRLYIGKSTLLKVFLLGGVAVVSAVFILYTFDLIGKLQVDTRSQVEKYVKMWQLAANSPTSGRELQFVFDEIIVKATFPIAVLDENRQPIHWRNIDGVEPGDTSAAAYERVQKAANEMLEENGEFPLYFGENRVNYFCYGDSEVVTQLTWMPFVEIGIVLAFLIVGFIGFQNIRRSEERYIWVGMAKETAHQLGTPITSLMGWLEVMQSECSTGGSGDQEMLNETVINMRTDVNRLQKIANRFGKIGSVPELRPCRLNELIRETVDYYRRRLPFEGKGTQIHYEPVGLPEAMVNPELFGWALENLIKNSLQAVDPREGEIRIETRHDPNRDEVQVSITDNGPGISAPAARKIFRAGFTTKKRGWGLGLTLVKRIVEEYHQGHIVLRKSRPGETTFEICLPVRAGQTDSKEAI